MLRSTTNYHKVKVRQFNSLPSPLDGGSVVDNIELEPRLSSKKEIRFKQSSYRTSASSVANI